MKLFIIKLKEVLPYILVGLLIVLMIVLITIEVYVWCTYANTPVGDIPTWAVWFMFGAERR